MHAVKSMEVSHARGLGGLAAGTLTGFVASVGLGTLFAKYSDKSWAEWLPAIFAAVGKAGTLGLYLATGNKHHVTLAVLNDFGQAGVNALGLDLGIKAGAKWAGEEWHVVKKGTALPPGGHRVAGDLPPGQPGRTLDEIAVEDLANVR